MAWIQKKLRDATVFARCDDAGELLAEDGRVEVRYKAGGGRAYRAGARNLLPVGGATVLPDSHCGDAEAVSPTQASSAKKKTKATAPAKAPAAHEEGAVIVYADGACSGNPGPAGLGVVIVDGEDRAELSEFLGRGTNNVAELTAILRAAERLSERDAPVRIYTDSKYSIGVLTQGWKAKKNPELVERAKAALSQLADVRLYYVPGHAGVELNERADELARAAVVARASSGWARPRR